MGDFSRPEHLLEYGAGLHEVCAAIDGQHPVTVREGIGDFGIDYFLPHYGVIVIQLLKVRGGGGVL